MSPNYTEIRKIKQEDLPVVKDFPPVEWNMNLEMVYSFHFNQPNFYAAVAIADSEIVGTGMVIINKTVAWLGTIIVKDNFRNKGIGNAITRHLIDFAERQGVETVILTASDMGMPIYQKLGFQTDIHYLVFKPNEVGTLNYNRQFVRNFEDKDIEAICDLDFSISGEDRTELLSSNMQDGLVYWENGLKGFYLPNFGKGLIIANDNTAGIELLKYKITAEKSPICVPETNVNAVNLLLSAGYNQSYKIPRMFLGENVEWKPELVFSRGSGYMG